MGGICQIWDTPHIWQTFVTNPKIRDVNFYGTVVYRGPYSTNPSDKLLPIWFVRSGWDLSYVGGFVIYGWGLSYMGGICQMWGGLSYMGGVCQIWAPIYYGTVKVNVANNWSFSVLSIWARHFPIFDKSKRQTSTEYFSKVDPLQLLKSWKRALWLAKKWSHGQFWGLSLVESTACVFPYPPRSRGVCHIWVGFVKSGILPIYDKPLWQTPRFATLTFTVP